MQINLFSKDLGVDLGTANTLVFCKGKGIVLREPSVVAMRRNEYGEDEILAIGEQASKMLGRTPGYIYAIRPLKDGAIANFELTEIMLKYFIKKTLKNNFIIGFKPRIVICVPFGVTDVERRAVEEAAKTAGAREVVLLEEPLAAAIGAGLPAREPIGSMIIDIGGGTTEVAIISLGGIVCCQSIRVGGDAMNEALINYTKKHHNILIGEAYAEQTKNGLGDATIDKGKDSFIMQGIHMFTGLPKSVIVTRSELYEALNEPLKAIIESVKSTMEKAPPDLASDIINNGIYISGGVAQLNGIDRIISEEVNIAVHIAENPLDCVVKGAAAAIDLISEINKIPTNDFMWN